MVTTLPQRTHYTIDYNQTFNEHHDRKTSLERSGVHFPMLAASTKHSNKIKSPHSTFKKTHSVANSKMLTPMGATTSGKVTHGLAGDIYKSKVALTEEPNMNSLVNPFKYKSNMQEILIQREKERYAKLAKRDFNIKQLTGGPIDDQRDVHKFKTQNDRRANSMQASKA